MISLSRIYLSIFVRYVQRIVKRQINFYAESLTEERWIQWITSRTKHHDVSWSFVGKNIGEARISMDKERSKKETKKKSGNERYTWLRRFAMKMRRVSVGVMQSERATFYQRKLYINREKLKNVRNQRPLWHSLLAIRTDGPANNRVFSRVFFTEDASKKASFCIFKDNKITLLSTFVTKHIRSYSWVKAIPRINVPKVVLTGLYN